ncbi:NAD-dependent protein deacetylase Sirt7 [Episyrphus balteatus]|uniref:NAD-dependent protein deacetylase Sirt7 n=1 Tax=Episyrphus balteatus TaxID=286459 RepID=UPI0024852AAB|nr:NAD-dependent protein deacetylase Sirt7 [Episyrphus balteatus]XP_055852203.1 NAD-dependent protein deacetylase Sirt7 [Episyrphus balteatus]
MENHKEVKTPNYNITRRKLTPAKNADGRSEKKERMKKISIVLKKCESTWTQEDYCLLEKNVELVRQIKTRKERVLLYKERVIEKEDSISVIEDKVADLAKIISQAKHLVCYTGAGISTSAHIPDYRGSNGIWTLLQKGQDIGNHDLSLANPTYTHMALYELYKRKLLHHIVSQNCDGLHLRSGLPVKSISEIHGNMYIEICSTCKPNAVYWRLFDTTEITARYAHKTNRRCYKCESPLIDTIVHFGEKGVANWPLNWVGACLNAEKADVILCLGSSLKVLKKYHWLWQMDRPSKNRAKICILNLQWTPKDNIATIKINGKCDVVMKQLMNHLNIQVQPYSKNCDPIFAHATALLPEELHTVSQPQLKREVDLLKREKEDCSNNLEKVKQIFPPSNLVINKGPLTRTPIKHRSGIKTSFSVGLSNGYGSNDSATQRISIPSEEKLKEKRLSSEISSDSNIYIKTNNGLPFWFDVSYAYSGLHSIVNPPPTELNLWSLQILPIFQMNRKAAECEFCFDKYAELDCQFYKSWSHETSINKFSRNLLIFCECCDNSHNKEESLSTKTFYRKNLIRIQAGWYGKGYKKNINKRRKH